MKPAEFFIGIVDLFAVLLPGSLATAALLQLLLTHLDRCYIYTRSILILIPDGQFWPYWLAFALFSYLLGHFIFLIGSVSLDNFYDATYRAFKRGEDRALQSHAKELLLTAPLNLSTDEIDSTLQWSTTFLRLRAPIQAMEIDRLEADSKFFRSLTILLLFTDLLIPLFLFPSALRWVINFRWVTSILIFLLLVGAISVLGNWRKPDDRVRKHAYRRYLSRTAASADPTTDTSLDDWL